MIYLARLNQILKNMASTLMQVLIKIILNRY